MGAIYIGGQNSRKAGGSRWKIYTFLFLFIMIIGAGLKVTAPTIVEKKCLTIRVQQAPDVPFRSGMLSFPLERDIWS
jgi:hypothetical protein